MRVNHGVVRSADEDEALNVYNGDAFSLSQPTIR